MHAQYQWSQCGEEKNVFLLPWIKLQPSSLQTVTVLTELPQLLPWMSCVKVYGQGLRETLMTLPELSFSYSICKLHFLMSPGNRYVGNVCSTMDWWWMDRALILHSMHHKSILKHSKTYAKPALLSYVAACPLYKNVRCVIFLQMHNIV